eukprot:gene31077-38981_t
MARVLGNAQKIIEAGRSTPWTERKHKNAFWRGAARTSGLRDTLIACSGKPEGQVPDVDITMQVEDTPKTLVNYLGSKPQCFTWGMAMFLVQVERVVVLKPPKGGPKQHIPYTLGDMKNPPPIIFSAARNP